ncbi:MAG: hypothetical protein Q7S03_04335 [bacterium]|nr:hypothetical protein [bacterium]
MGTSETKVKNLSEEEAKDLIIKVFSSLFVIGISLLLFNALWPQPLFGLLILLGLVAAGFFALYSILILLKIEKEKG